MSLTLQSTVKLNSGHLMPRFGFGVWDSPGHITATSVVNALKAGYRHIDTAQYYGNESEVGDGVRAFSTAPGGVPRKEVFVTTKMGAPASSHEATISALRGSVEKINLDGYVDLFLVHSPSSGGKGRRALWKGMEQLVEEGKAKSIGVSNYTAKHLQEMKEYAKVMPAVNQIELHPWCQQQSIVDTCEEMGIAIQAYCPLVRGEKASDPTLTKIAKKHSKSWAQVLLRWSLQKGYTPLPKSDKPERIISNADVYDFELDKSDMEALDALEAGEDGRLCKQSPEPEE